MSGSKPLMIGTATVDITPPIGATMVGFVPRKSTSIGHALEAEALYCSDGERGWALVAADMLGIEQKQSSDVRARIAEAIGIRAGAVTVCGTHTHSGPAVILADSDDLDDIDRDYLDGLWGKLTDVAIAAKNNATAGRFEAASTTLREVGSNRRIKGPDGTWINEWNDPEGRHPGFFDSRLDIVKVLRPDGRPDAAVVNYGVHPVVLGPSSLAISPDYPGHLRDSLRSALGVRDVLFLLAGAGNINPRHCLNSGEEHPREVGGVIAERALSLSCTPVAGGRVGSACVSWEIERDRDAHKRAGLAGRRKGDRILADVCAMRAGDLSIVTIPAELFSEFNEKLRQLSSTAVTLIASVSNDYIGYIPTDRGQEEGAYETKMAPSAHLEEPLLDCIRRACEEVA